MMPDLNGIEFINAVRKTHPADTVPILMVTAAHEKEIRYQSLTAGANDFLTKPIDRHEFDPRVRTMLALRNSHTRLRNWNDDLRQAVIHKTADIVARERETIARWPVPPNSATRKPAPTSCAWPTTPTDRQALGLERRTV
jgi:DNA-binding response OmpR family regulator